MAQYQKNVSIGGKWARASELKSGMRCRIVSETNPSPSQFFNKDNSVKMQDVCQVKFEGLNDVLNVSLNRATINALIDAFGTDSASWMNKILTVETERVRVAGKAVTALYLIPEGFEKTDDENGYAVIAKVGTHQPAGQHDDIPVINADEDEKIDPKDLPF